APRQRAAHSDGNDTAAGRPGDRSGHRAALRPCGPPSGTHRSAAGRKEDTSAMSPDTAPHGETGQPAAAAAPGATSADQTAGPPIVRARSRSGAGPGGSP